MNWAVVRGLAVGTEFDDTTAAVVAVCRDTDARLHDQLRRDAAVPTLRAAVTALDDIEAEPAQKQAAVLDVALDLLTSVRPPD